MNSRAGCPTYRISSADPSATWVHLHAILYYRTEAVSRQLFLFFADVLRFLMLLFCVCFGFDCVYYSRIRFFCLKALLLRFFEFAQLAEKTGKHRAALFLQNSAGDVYFMIEAVHFEKIQDRTGASCFWIHACDDGAGDP